MRQYLAGSEPGARKLAQIAEATEVTLEWLATGRLPKEPRSHVAQKQDTVDRVFAAYTFAATLNTLLEAATDVVKTSESQRELLSRAVNVYMSLPPPERDRGGRALIRSIIDRLLAGEKK